MNKIKSWYEIINNFIDFEKSIVVKPNKKYIELYRDMVDLYKKYEEYILKSGENPEMTRLGFNKKYF